MTERLDVVGIGNAMVDAIIPSNKTEIEKHQINRDSMNLIDEGLKNNLHESYSIKEMAKNEKVIQAIQQQVDKANSQVANVQGIKKFVLLENEWTDSSGELTPTLKLKRNVIAEMYNDEIESMYEEV